MNEGTEETIDDAIYLMLQAIFVRLTVMDGFKHGTTNGYRDMAEKIYSKLLQKRSAVSAGEGR